MVGSARGGGGLMGTDLHMYSVPEHPPRRNKTHKECSCALPFPTDHPHASLEDVWGGGGSNVCVRVCRAVVHVMHNTVDLCDSALQNFRCTCSMRRGVTPATSWLNTHTHTHTLR